MAFVELVPWSMATTRASAPWVSDTRYRLLGVANNAFGRQPEVFEQVVRRPGGRELGEAENPHRDTRVRRQLRDQGRDCGAEATRGVCLFGRDDRLRLTRGGLDRLNVQRRHVRRVEHSDTCLLYTSDAAD